MRRHWARAHASLESRGARLPALSPPLPPRRKIIVRTRAPDDKLFIAFMTGALFRTVRSFLCHSRVVRSPQERRNRADLIELFKTTKGLSSTPWSHFFFKKAEDTSTRGQTWKLAKKHRRCDSRLYFFSQRVIINGWNNLSQEDVDAQSINCFKNRPEKTYTADGLL